MELFSQAQLFMKLATIPNLMFTLAGTQCQIEIAKPSYLSESNQLVFLVFRFETGR